MVISEHKQAYLYTHSLIQLTLWCLQWKQEQVRARRCVWAHTHPKRKTYINMKFSIFIIGTYFYSFLIIPWFCFHREKRAFLFFFFSAERLLKNLLKSTSFYEFAFFIISLAITYEIKKRYLYVNFLKNAFLYSTTFSTKLLIKNCFKI